jgi:hypothetical protein
VGPLHAPSLAAGPCDGFFLCYSKSLPVPALAGCVIVSGGQQTGITKQRMRRLSKENDSEWELPRERRLSGR